MTCLGYNEVFKNNLLSIFYRKTAIILLLFLQYNIKGRACLKVYLFIFLFLPVRNTLKELADFSKCVRRVFLILTLKHWELILTLLWQTLKKKTRTLFAFKMWVQFTSVKMQMSGRGHCFENEGFLTKIAFRSH